MPAANFEIQRKCKECGATFLAKTVESVYCSKKCTNAAYRKKKREEKHRQKLDEVVGAIPENRDYISVSEAEAMFGVSRYSLYKYIRLGKIQAINLGQKLTRINKHHLMAMFPERSEPIDKQQALPKSYSLEPEDCYTIGEISQKYKLSESTVYKNIREHAIPIRQIGKFVYVPKSEIDTLFKKGSMI